MPEKHSGPAMPEGTARPYVKGSCARGAVQDIKIFNGGGKIHTAPAGRRLVHAVCQWELVHSAGLGCFCLQR